MPSSIQLGRGGNGTEGKKEMEGAGGEGSWEKQRMEQRVDVLEEHNGLAFSTSLLVLPEPHPRYKADYIAVVTEYVQRTSGPRIES